ncbi:MAG: hypothetical protein IJZ94_05385 [Clostridia bacterium]|nr:hypothetical protein [Clostridia bacterium]
MDERVVSRKCNYVIKRILIVAGVITCLIIITVGIHNIFFLTPNELRDMSGEYVCRMDECVINVNFSEEKYGGDSAYPLINGTVTFSDGKSYEAYVSVMNGGCVYYYDEPIIAAPDRLNITDETEFEKQLAEYDLWVSKHCITLAEDRGGKSIYGTVSRAKGDGFYIDDELSGRKYIFTAKK